MLFCIHRGNIIRELENRYLPLPNMSDEVLKVLRNNTWLLHGREMTAL
jgi:hypothetical protein